MIPQCLTVACLIGLRPIINKHLLKLINVNSLIVFSGIINFIFILLYILFIERDNVIKDFHKIRNDKTALFLMVFITFCIFIVIDYATFELLKIHKAYLIESVIAIYPLITMLFGYLILNETVSYTHFLGVIFIITGIILLVH
jgi:drug/metabolite transporter (DMT)-like permease